MKVASALFMVAAALVAADDDMTTSGTTTITATTTRTVTIMSCNPSHTNCPYMSTSTSADAASPTPSTVNTKPVYSTSSYMNNTSAYVLAPTSAKIPGPNSSAPGTVPANGAHSVFVSPGLLLGVLAGTVLL